MSDLIAITFDNIHDATAARSKFHTMQKEHLVELEDSAIVYKNDKGQVRIDQTVDLPAAGAASGGFWGLLIGFIFSFPFGGPLLPFVTAVFGAGFGALSGHLADYGIDDAMMKDLGSHLEQGRCALFILVRKQTIDRVLESLEGTHGTVLKTSLSRDLEKKFREVLSHAAAAHPTEDIIAP